MIIIVIISIIIMIIIITVMSVVVSTIMFMVMVIIMLLVYLFCKYALCTALITLHMPRPLLLARSVVARFSLVPKERWPRSSRRPELGKADAAGQVTR